MSKITKKDELLAMKKGMSARLAIRDKVGSSAGDAAPFDLEKEGCDIMLCMGTSCMASGAEAVRYALQAVIEEHGLTDKIRIQDDSCPGGSCEREKTEVKETGCNGFCANGPIMVIYPYGYFYQKIQPADAKEIVESHILEGKPVERLMYRDVMTEEPIPLLQDIPFFSQQELKVLRNKGKIAAESLEEYIARDGYFAAEKALNQMDPQGIIDEVRTAGLRGRGGAGFPTGMKWQFCKDAEGDKKYILCNADEGDPGAFMDRSLIESDPHALIEGMLIGARAIGADEGYIYCRAEYPLALHRLETAIEACEQYGLLGDNIFGSGFSFRLHIARGSGAFVCGEETALMRSIEGKRGEPRPRPPFPAHKGLWEKPTVLNNVETFGNVPLIIREGAESYRSVGTTKSPGTKIFALTGNLNNIGLIEVPIGIPLGEIIYDIGGGIAGGKEYKATQIGGPSGGCIPKEHLNVPMDYESVQELGAIMGSGGLVVMDDDTCMVDVARFFLEFVQEESCGKCVPCRVGTKRMLEVLTLICEGDGVENDIDLLFELGEQIKTTALCGLGQTAPNPVLSTLRHFMVEYEQHIREKHCIAGVCPSLVRAPCQSACPAGVDVPGFVSLVGEQRYAEALQLHRERNPFAAVCARVCFHTCEDKCRRSTLDQPVAIRGVKRYMVDQEITIQHPEVLENEENAKRKIAIIGAGPAGLSCAYFLARLGYKPKVFESEQRPGGMLVQAIPAYRLPRETLAREIRMIEQLGVEIVTEKRLGKDFTLQQLKEEGYEAIFLGVGAPECLGLGVTGEEGEGVIEAGRFLNQYNIRGSVPVGKKVVVVGGGNAAIDAARTALRLGGEVTVIYRRTQEQMPAYAEEIEEALLEGVSLKTLMQPVEVMRDGSGKVTGLKCINMMLGDFDRSGRRRPTESEEIVDLQADQIIVAIGQTLDTKNILGDMDVELTRKGFIKANQLTGQTSVEWLFSGGDAAVGPASVVTAVGDGERAAVGMDLYFTGEDHAFWREERENDTDYDPDADPTPYQREKMPTINVEKRRANFDEVEMPWIESVAIRQCKRCLRCDYGKTPMRRKIKKEAVHG